MNVILDCNNLAERAQAHEYLAKMLNFPEYYGKNLDALYDCLMDLGDCAVTLENADTVDGGYGAVVLKVLEEAAQANPGLRLEVH